MSKPEITKDLKQYLPKTKRERKREKFGTLLSRIINPVTLPFKHGLVYKKGSWQFAKIGEKPKKIRNTFRDGTPKWNLDEAGPLPMDDNTIRRLTEVQNENEATAPKSKTKQKARKFIPAGTKVEDVFDQLNEAGIKYAVLRWFDKLPVVDPGEDIDMLVEDSAVEKLGQFFQSRKSKGAIPCDIYSASGIAGTSFEGIPYFEKRLAEQILDNTVMHAGRFKVPDTKHHFLSLAYHVVYHKAHASGLPFQDGEPPLKIIHDHDYGEVLGGLAKELKLDFGATLVDLHDTLRAHDWAPAIDTIRKLSMNRPLLTRTLDMPKYKGSDGPNLCVFVVRDWAMKRRLIPWLAANIRFFGFDIKLIHELSEEEREKARANIRGGNWNKGPWPVSGGAPAAIIVAYDYTPEPPDSELMRKQPFAANARFVTLKKILRDGVNNNLPKHLHANGVHSADDDLEAWDYIETICPEQVNSIKADIESGFLGDPFIKQKLHQGKRASSYLVYKDRNPCVLKVFSDSKEGRECYLAERLAFDLFANKSWSPGWLEFGPNWMLQRYYDQSTRLDYLVPAMDEASKLKLAKDIIAMLKDIYQSGRAHRDIHAQNIFITSDGLALIDFETLCQQPQNASFDKSYDITGEGLETPFGTGRMGFDNRKNPRSLCNTLGVSFSDAMSVK